MSVDPRRDELARRMAEAQWHLGGLTYEMAIRDHFCVDLLVRRAADLQRVDAELAVVDRLRHLGETGEAGACPRCAAPHTRGAVFCWQCWHQLLATDPAAAARRDGAV